MILELQPDSLPTAWALRIADEARTSGAEPPHPERTLYAAVIVQAYKDALATDRWTANVGERADARRFFRDWRIEAICDALGIPVDRVRCDFERKLVAVRRGARLRYGAMQQGAA